MLTPDFSSTVMRNRQPPPKKSIPSAEIDQRRAFYSYYPFQGITGTSEFSSLKKIVLNIQTVSVDGNSRRIYQSACSFTILCVGEHPVLSSYNKRSDRIFSSVVVYGNIRRSKKSVKIFLFIYRIAYCLGQLCAG